MRKWIRRMFTTINETQCKRVLEVVDAGLCSGIGIPEPGHMCVEAAVCFAFGEEHGDNPSCVNPRIRDMKVVLNDSSWWDGYKDRASGLRRLAIAQLGTAEMSYFRSPDFDGKMNDMIFQVLKKEEPNGRLYCYRDAKQTLYQATVAFMEPRFEKSILQKMNARMHALAEGFVQVLKEQQTPGSVYLYLTEPMHGKTT